MNPYNNMLSEFIPMPRKPRTHFVGAIYHVMLRGNNKQIIFHNDAQRLQFLGFLQEGVGKFRFKLHAYCLMPNHVHLIIEIGEICLAKIIHNISYRYSRWLNYQLKYIGHLFQGRYKAILIQEEKYILELCRYIHLNPVKARLVDSLEKYLWSSHRAYLGIDLDQAPFLTTEFILGILQKQFIDKKIKYEDFIRENVDYEFLPALSLSDTGKLVINDIIMENNAKNIGIKKHTEVSLETIIDVVCNFLGVTKVEIMMFSKQRRLVEARATIAIFAQKYGVASITELAHIFRRDISSISYARAKLEKMQYQRLDIARKLAQIKARLRL